MMKVTTKQKHKITKDQVLVGTVQLSRLPTSEMATQVETSCSVSGRSPGERNGYSLQYSCLENSMDRGAWWLQSIGLRRVGNN